MRPTNRLFLFLLIILLFFITVPAVDAQAAGVDFETAVEIDCDESGLSYSGEITLPAQVPPQEDYYKIHLVAGQKLIIDVDALDSGSDLDSLLQLFDSSQKFITENDTGSLDPLNEDPYLEFFADVDGDYFLVISASTPGDGADTGTYSFLLECSDPSIPPDPFFPLKVGDLLGATGSDAGSLLDIDPSNATNSTRFPLGVGRVSDIEFDPFSQKVFIATSAELGGLLAIDPDTGTELKFVSLDAGFVTALEAAEGSLFGVHQYIDDTVPTLSLVSIDQDSLEFIAEVPITRSVVSLAYHAVDKVMYGVAPGGTGTTGSELVKIDLTTGEIMVVGDPLVGVIAALDFNQDNILHVVERSGVLFNIPDLTLIEPAVKIGSIIDTSAINTMALGSNSAAVSGLTFVVGETPDDEPIKIMCSSTLASQMDADSASADHKLSKFKLRNRLRSGAISLFKFQAEAGENIIIRLMPEVEEVAATDEESAVSELETSWPRWHWRHWKGEGRLFLGLRDAIPGVKRRERTKGTLPLELAVENLAEGQYYIMVIQPLFRYKKVDYCLTMESDYEDSQARQTLQVAWPSDESQDDTASTTTTAKTAAVESVDEQASGVNTDTDTDNNPGDPDDVDEGERDSEGALNNEDNTAGADDEATDEDKSAADADNEDGQTIDNTTITTDHPVDIVAENPRDPVDVDDEDGNEDEPNDDHNTAGSDGETTTGEDESATEGASEGGQNT